MRRFISCAGAASLTTIAALVIGLGVSACGSSTGTTTSTESVPRPSGMPQGGGVNGDPSAMLGSRLDPLVEDGTLTGAQEESVIAALSTPPEGAPAGLQ